MLFSSNGSLANNAPKYTMVPNINPRGATVNNTTLFQNTTPGAFVNNMVVGVYGVSAGLVAVSQSKDKNISTAPGWVLRRHGMGSITSIGVSAANGSGYSNNDLLNVTANNCLNTSANVITNNTGGIVGFANFTNNGGMFPNTAYITIAISNTTGGTANGSAFSNGTVTLGGRANRTTNEVLVVMPSMTVNSSTNTAAFPNI